MHELHIVYAGDEERSVLFAMYTNPHTNIVILGEFAAQFKLDFSDDTTEEIQRKFIPITTVAMV